MVFQKAPTIFFSTLISYLPSMKKYFLYKIWIDQVQSAQAKYEEPDDPIIRELLVQ